MKKAAMVFLIPLIISTLFVSPLWAGKKETPPAINGAKNVNADTLKKWLDEGEEMIILDPRKASDFDSKGHIPTAVSCPVNTDVDLTEKVISETIKSLEQCDGMKGVEKGEKIITYCNGITCWMSPKAVTALVKMGYSNVFWFRDGMKSWNGKGFPVE